ncbi:MAG: hypothetical protein IIA09_10305 [Proteobacteria bacterium]|nr:hypothetical protein [Pseudomonadota bacterium]
MSNDKKRAAKIIAAANAAISKITDPVKRTAAKDKLTLAKRKIVEAGRRTTTRTQKAQHRELDFDR